MDVKLDALIEPNMSFIAPRSDDDILKNCLSNIFVAAEPGHPILARAIENVMRLLLLGSEAHQDKESESVERFILESSGKAIDETEVWKLRAVQTQENYVYRYVRELSLSSKRTVRLNHFDFTCFAAKFYSNCEHH